MLASLSEACFFCNPSCTPAPQLHQPAESAWLAGSNLGTAVSAACNVLSWVYTSSGRLCTELVDI